MFRGLASVLGSLFVLACNAEPSGNDGGMSCVPGQGLPCNCVDGSPGAATCGFDGVAGPCLCTGMTTAPTGDVTGDPTATTTDASDTTSPCVTDCSEDTTSASADSGSACPIFAGKVDNVSVPWSFSGQIGIPAGELMCDSIDADHVCEYAEVLAADQAGEFEALGSFSAWIHRTTVESVDGVPSAPGIGGRCLDWSDSASMLADGEWADVTPGGVTYHLDADTFYDGLDPSHTNPMLPCAATTRAVLCCNPACDD
jgi:hypothetical protein